MYTWTREEVVELLNVFKKHAPLYKPGQKWMFYNKFLREIPGNMIIISSSLFV